MLLVCTALIIGVLDFLEIQASRALDIQLLFLTASFEDYPILCDRLEEAMVFCPGKLEYI